MLHMIQYAHYVLVLSVHVARELMGSLPIVRTWVCAAKLFGRMNEILCQHSRSPEDDQSTGTKRLCVRSLHDYLLQVFMFC